MKNQNRLQKVGLLIGILFGAVILFIGINNVLWTRMVKKQETIHLPLEMVVNALQESDLPIEKIEYDYLPPTFQTAENGLRIFIDSSIYAYEVNIIKTSSWKMARSSSICTNKHTCGSIAKYSFYLGDLYFSVYPDDKAMGEELKEIIENTLLNTAN